MKITVRIMMCLCGMTAMAMAMAQAGPSKGKPYVHPLFSDHAVLQREAPITVWGWSVPGSNITVRLGDSTAQSVVGKDGHWQAVLAPMAAGGPHELRVAGPSTVILRDIMIGDVWLCAGQSTMKMPMLKARNAAAEIAAANFQNLRLFDVPSAFHGVPQARMDSSATWTACTPASVAKWSATAYFFGREIHQAADVPIGLVVAARVGSTLWAWISEASLIGISDPMLAKNLANLKRSRQAHSYVACAGLFNGMIAPLRPFGFKGIVWHQGEANSGIANLNVHLQLYTRLLQDWRMQLTAPAENAPFLVVQLPSHGPRSKSGVVELDGWAAVREAQSRAVQASSNAYLAITFDISQDDDAQPPDHQEVGRRLGLIARANAYADNVEWSGPTYHAMQPEGDKIRLTFQRAIDGLLTSDGEGKPVQGFAVAGTNRVFVAAEAVLEAPTILVFSPDVEQPVAVRYGWADNPTANVTSQAELPLVPFRTDRWPKR